MVVNASFCNFTYNREQRHWSVIAYIFTSLAFIYRADVSPIPMYWEDAFMQGFVYNATNARSPAIEI